MTIRRLHITSSTNIDLVGVIIQTFDEVPLSVAYLRHEGRFTESSAL